MPIRLVGSRAEIISRFPVLGLHVFNHSWPFKFCFLGISYEHYIYIIFSLPLLPLILPMSVPLLKAIAYSFIIIITHTDTQFINSLLSSCNIAHRCLGLISQTGCLIKEFVHEEDWFALPQQLSITCSSLSRGEACENSPSLLACQ